MSAPIVRVVDYTGTDQGDSPTITVEAGNPVIFGLGHWVYQSLRTASFKWTASGVGDTYYLEASAGGDPGVTFGNNGAAYFHGKECSEGGSTTTLLPMQFKLGDSNSLGYTTLYIKVPSGESDPDTYGVGAVYWVRDNTAFAWGAGGISTVQEVYWLTPADVTIKGFVCGFEAVASGDLVCTVVNKDGLSDSITVTVTVNASTRTTKTAGVDDTLSNLLTTFGATNNIEFVVPSGAHSTGAKTLTGDNVVINLQSGSVVTVSGNISCHGENFGVKGTATITGATGPTTPFVCAAGAATPATRHYFKDFTYNGDISALFSVDGFGAGMFIDGVVAGDLSGTLGQRAYFLYDVNRGDGSYDARPHKLLMIRNCTNNYGSRDEAATRYGGDLVSVTGCTFEQTNVTSSARNKSLMRTVGGRSHWISGNTLRIVGDTSGLGLNGSQGMSAWETSPAGASLDNASWNTNGVIFERNSVIGGGIVFGSRIFDTPSSHKATTIRRNIFDWVYPKHAEIFQIGVAPTIGTEVQIDDLRIIHNTFVADQADHWKCWDFRGFTGDKVRNLLIQNNLAINPSVRLQVVAAEGSIFGLIRSTDSGATQFTSLRDNCWPVPDESAAGGQFPAGSFAFVDASTVSSSIGTAKTAAVINALSYADGNTREDVTVDGSYRVTGTPTAKTQMSVLSDGVVRDYNDVLFSAGDAIGAVSNNLVDPGDPEPGAFMARGVRIGGLFLRIS